MGGELLRCDYRLVVCVIALFYLVFVLLTACLFFLLASGLLLFDCLVARADLWVVVLVVYSWCFVGYVL